MKPERLKILLADDDEDDCMFFRDALLELSVEATLNTVANGVDLMQFLTMNVGQLPQVLFLDLNMPRKTGFECLLEIKHDAQLKQLPVIIYSTSFNPDVTETLYSNGAQHYIRKPADFSDLKKVIKKAIEINLKQDFNQPPKEKFEIHP